MLEKLADRLSEDRYELSALEMFEVAKPWREADADVADAIDFCRLWLCGTEVLGLLTCAFVHRQPFGGFGMSGIGTKAGGPGYLRHFADPRCVTDNTMRQGFTPEVTL